MAATGAATRRNRGADRRRGIEPALHRRGRGGRRGHRGAGARRRSHRRPSRRDAAPPRRRRGRRDRRLHGDDRRRAARALRSRRGRGPRRRRRSVRRRSGGGAATTRCASSTNGIRCSSAPRAHRLGQPRSGRSVRSYPPGPRTCSRPSAPARAKSWLVGGVGRVLPARVYEMIVSSLPADSLYEEISLQRFDRIAGPRGLERPGGRGRAHRLPGGPRTAPPAELASPAWPNRTSNRTLPHRPRDLSVTCFVCGSEMRPSTRTIAARRAVGVTPAATARTSDAAARCR